jgi:hypothetical protein
MTRFHQSPPASTSFPGRGRTAADRLLAALACLLLLAAAPASDCRFSSGPDGLCAAFRLDPASAELPVGSTLQIRVNDFDCDGIQSCVSCSDGRRRMRWESSAPEFGVPPSALTDFPNLLDLKDLASGDSKVISA